MLEFTAIYSVLGGSKKHVYTYIYIYICRDIDYYGIYIYMHVYIYTYTTTIVIWKCIPDSFKLITSEQKFPIHCAKKGPPPSAQRRTPRIGGRRHTPLGPWQIRGWKTHSSKWFSSRFGGGYSRHDFFGAFSQGPTVYVLPSKSGTKHGFRAENYNSRSKHECKYVQICQNEQWRSHENLETTIKTSSIRSGATPALSRIRTVSSNSCHTCIHEVKCPGLPCLVIKHVQRLHGNQKTRYCANTFNGERNRSW